MHSDLEQLMRFCDILTIFEILWDNVIFYIYGIEFFTASGFVSFN